MPNKTINNTHWITDTVIAISIFIALTVYEHFNKSGLSIIEKVCDLNSTLMGIWATIVGFLITAVSILVTIKDTKYITALKTSGHFNELLKVFLETCYLIAFLLCVMFIIAIIVISNNIILNIILFLNILSFVRIFTCLYVLYKLINLANAK